MAKEQTLRNFLAKWGVAVLYLIETNSFGCETINSLSIEINDYSSVTENSVLII